MTVKITGSDRETARFFFGLLRGHLVGITAAESEKVLVEGLARLFAFQRDQIVSVAVVAAEREREKAPQKSRPKRRM